VPKKSTLEKDKKNRTILTHKLLSFLVFPHPKNNSFVSQIFGSLFPIWGNWVCFNIYVHSI